MKELFEYPEPGAYRRKIADAVARVYKAVGIPADGTLLAECFINSLYRPVYALLETPGDVAEFLQIMKRGESSLNFDGGRGERLEAVVRGHFRNSRCLVQIWGANDIDSRVYDLTYAVRKATREFPLGDGIVACHCYTDVDYGRAINLFWLPEDAGEVSDEEALAALDGIDCRGRTPARGVSV